MKKGEIDEQFYKETTPYGVVKIYRVDNENYPDIIKTVYDHITEDRQVVKLHKIYVESKVLEPSVLIGGHRGGQLSTIQALIETQDGRYMIVNPVKLKKIQKNEEQ